MPYLIMKLIHIFAVVLFVGCMSVALYLKSFGEKKKDIGLLLFTFEGIRASGKFFIMPAVTLLILFGIGGAAHAGRNLLTTGWILWSEILIIISAIAYMAGVIPTQKKILEYANKLSTFSWDEYNQLSGKWTIWMLIALIASLIAIVLMTLRIPA
ncbi:MAG: DUF2269 domain-containing protein [Ignavibacteriaceae bacterium]|nr:DUF2269 domain-containing protein [Ignavibacteriaceae bacterium]